MEVWTFIHKETNKIIRFNVIYSDDSEFGTEYLFTTNKYSPIWFVETEEEAKLAYSDSVHAQFSMFYDRPSTDDININEFEIIKFEIIK
jgi:hypothetical protein